MYMIYIRWNEMVTEVAVEAFTREAAVKTWDALSAAGAIMQSARP